MIFIDVRSRKPVDRNGAYVVAPARKSARAEQDLIDILAYIARDSPDASLQQSQRFDAVFRLLADHPRAGTDRRRYGPAMRSFVTGKYLVLYRLLDGDQVQIVRILHGARDIERLFAEDDVI